MMAFAENNVKYPNPMKHPQEIISPVSFKSYQVPDVFEKEQLIETAVKLNQLVYGEEHSLKEIEAEIAKCRLHFDHLSYMQVMFDVHECILWYSYGTSNEYLKLLSDTRAKVEHLIRMHPENLNITFIEAQLRRIQAYHYSRINASELAIQHFSQVVRLSEKLSYTKDLGNVIANLAKVSYTLGDVEGCLRYLDHALLIVGQSDAAIAAVHSLLGVCLCDLERYDEAILSLERSISLLNDKDIWQGYQATSCFAYVYCCKGEMDNALAWIQRLEHLADGIGLEHPRHQMRSRYIADQLWLLYYLKSEQFHKGYEKYQKMDYLESSYSAENLDTFERLVPILAALDKFGELSEVFEQYKVTVKKVFSKRKLAALNLARSEFDEARVLLTCEHNFLLLEKENRQVKEIEQLIEQEKEIRQQLEIEKTRVNLKSLSRRIDPQFMFDSVNSISSFIEGNDTEAANKYLSLYSKLMRVSLVYSNQEIVSLEEEIDILELYLELQKLRRNSSFEYRISTPAALPVFALSLPPMLIQPHIEKAIRDLHNFEQEDVTALLCIDFSESQHYLNCSISYKYTESENIDPQTDLYALEIAWKRIELINKINDKAILIKENVQETQLYHSKEVRLCFPI